MMDSRRCACVQDGLNGYFLTVVFGLCSTLTVMGRCLAGALSNLIKENCQFECLILSLTYKMDQSQSISISFTSQNTFMPNYALLFVMMANWI